MRYRNKKYVIIPRFQKLYSTLVINMSKGLLFAISGPSGVGKTTIANEILVRTSSTFFHSDSKQVKPHCKKTLNLSRVVTCTTRLQRDGEKNGVDYFFLKKEEFLKHKAAGDFIESSEVYGNYYGILVETILKGIDNGNNSLLVINWEGFRKIKQKFSNKVIGFFLVPPSLKDLEMRIRSRETDSEETIRSRMKMAKEDITHKNEFDFCIENVKVDETSRIIIEKILKYTQ